MFRKAVFLSAIAAILTLAPSTDLFAQKVGLWRGHGLEPIVVDLAKEAPMVKSGAGTFTKSTNDITWTITYLDVTGNNDIGFDDPSLGATRRATFEAVLEYVESVIQAPAPRTIDIEVQPSELDGTFFLASCGTYYPLADGYFPGSTLQRITNGTKPFGGFEEIQLTVDFGYTWNSDLGAPTGSEYDLFTVLLHEVTHGLGFASLSSSNGSSVFDTSENTFKKTYTNWDALIHRTAGGVKAWSASNPPTF